MTKLDDTTITDIQIRELMYSSILPDDVRSITGYAHHDAASLISRGRMSVCGDALGDAEPLRTRARATCAAIINARATFLDAAHLRVAAVLRDRSGFDHLMDSLDDETKHDLLSALVAAALGEERT